MAPQRLVTRAFGLVVLSAFGVMLAIGMLLPVLPLYAEGPLGVGDVGVGLAVAAASPTALLLQPFAGRYGDRIGRQPLLVTGCLLFGGTVLLYTFADSLALLVLLRLATGVGEALMFVATATIVNDLAPDGRTGEAVSLYSLAIWGGLAAGPLLGELILDGDRYDAVWVAAGISALLAAGAALALRETRPVVGDPPPEAPPRRSIIHPAARGPGAVLLLTMIGFAGFATFVPLYARELGLAGAGAVFAVNALIVVAIRSIGRRIPDRVGPRRAGIASGLLVTTGFVVIALAHSTTGLFVGTAILSVGQALAFPALMLYVVGRAPAAERSAAVGSFTASADLGFAIGAIGLGVVADSSGYRGVFVGAACAAAVGLVMLLRLAPARGRRAEVATGTE